MLKCEASIIILTKNAGNDFLKTLDAVYTQKYNGKFEVIVIDSGSTDRTIEVAKRYPTRIFTIKPEEFGHGRTRNLGVKLAHGRFLAFITQDAIPASDKWLDNLLRNLDDPSVAGVYGMQIPRRGINPVDCFFHSRVYLSYRMIREGYSEKSSLRQMVFSNVNSAVRKENPRNNPFCENIVHGEDQEWAKRMLLQGFKIVYDPEAAVFHSHNYTLKSIFQRCFDTGASFRQFASKEYSSAEVIKHGLNHVMKEMTFLLRNGYVKWIPYSVLYNLCKFLAYSLGKRERYLPRSLKKRISQNSAFWERT